MEQLLLTQISARNQNIGINNPLWLTATVTPSHGHINSDVVNAPVHPP